MTIFHTQKRVEFVIDHYLFVNLRIYPTHDRDDTGFSW